MTAVLRSALASFLVFFFFFAASHFVSVTQEFSPATEDWNHRDENKNDAGGVSPRLGDLSYSMDKISAPIVKGYALQVVSWVATRSVLGPPFLRYLLNKNGVKKVRELADQMTGLPTLHAPLYRMTPRERSEHDKIVGEAIDEQTDLSSLVPYVKDLELLERLSEESSSSTILNLHLAYKNDVTTPTKVIQKVLNAIDDLNPIYKPFSAKPQFADIVVSARRSHERYKQGKPLSIFDGVPVAFKDQQAIKGYILSHGSKYRRSKNTDTPQSLSDDLVVKRFRDLGAIILPPTSMTEFGVTPIGYGVQHKGPFNAHNVSHYSGGSSGGSATAVALGICPIAIGYDGGGSVRTPAAFSGVYGMATGYGRFVFGEQKPSTMNKAGVFGNSVVDVMLGYSVLARDVDVSTDVYSIMYDGGNKGLPSAHLQSLLSGGYRSSRYKDLSDVTIGVWYEWIEDASPSVVAATKSTLESLVARGAKVKEFRIPNINLARLSHGLKITAEFAMRWDRAYHDPQSSLEGNTRITIGLGLALGAVEVLAAEKVRSYIFDRVREIFVDGDIDVILTPTTSLTAPVIPEGAMEYGVSNTPLTVELCKYIFLGNLIGLPGMSSPIGVDPGGMPIGGLITSWQWDEDKIFRISRAIEDITHENKTRKHPKDKICLECDERL